MKKKNVFYFVLGMMIVGVGSRSVFAAKQYQNSDGTLNFLALKSTKNGNQLTAQMWDTLMDGLAKMQKTSPTPPPSVGAAIPAGAIMAFDLPNCPEGWTRFSEADNRFIMGASAGFGNAGGSNNVKLELKNIPPHSHYYKDTVFGEYQSSNDGNGEFFNSNLGVSHKNYQRLAASNKDFYYGVTFSHKMLGSAKSDYDNDPIYGIRGTSKQLCDFGYRDQTYVYGNRGDVDINGGFMNMKTLKDDIDAKCTSDSSSSTQPFSIINPYIKLLYCKKN